MLKERRVMSGRQREAGWYRGIMISSLAVLEYGAAGDFFNIRAVREAWILLFGTGLHEKFPSWKTACAAAWLSRGFSGYDVEDWMLLKWARGIRLEEIFKR